MFEDIIEKRVGGVWIRFGIIMVFALYLNCGHREGFYTVSLLSFITRYVFNNI